MVQLLTDSLQPALNIPPELLSKLLSTMFILLVLWGLHTLAMRLVTFESNWENAKRLLEEIIKCHAPEVSDNICRSSRRTPNRFVISYGTTTPIVYTEVAPSGVLLTMRYLVAPRKRRSSEQAIWEDVLRAFAQHWDIDFAYATTREFLHYYEGKRPPCHMTESPDDHSGTGAYPRPRTPNQADE